MYNKQLFRELKSKNFGRNGVVFLDTVRREVVVIWYGFKLVREPEPMYLGTFADLFPALDGVGATDDMMKRQMRLFMPNTAVRLLTDNDVSKEDTRRVAEVIDSHYQSQVS